MTTPTKEQIDKIQTAQCQKSRGTNCKNCVWVYDGPVCKEEKRLRYVGVKFIVSEWEKIRNGPK